jgi:hypothetical protein
MSKLLTEIEIYIYERAGFVRVGKDFAQKISRRLAVFDILASVKQGSSGPFEPQNRKPSKKARFSQILAVTGLRLTIRRTLVLLPPKSALLVLIYLPC